MILLSYNRDDFVGELGGVAVLHDNVCDRLFEESTNRAAEKEVWKRITGLPANTAVKLFLKRALASWTRLSLVFLFSLLHRFRQDILVAFDKFEGELWVHLREDAHQLLK